MQKLFRIWYIFLFALVLTPLHAAAAGIGFAASNGVSFSAENVFANKGVKAYAVVVNNVYQKVSATVAFYDNGTEFARTTIDIPLEEARQVNVIWVPTNGQHTVGAKFVAATATDANGNTKQLTSDEIANISSPVSNSLFVDADTDSDGIGDHEEITHYHTSPTNKDTDGDGLNDYDEIFKYKTDPNNANTDGDNMNDGDEIRAGRNPLVKDDPLPPPPPPIVIAPQQDVPQTKPAVPKQTQPTVANPPTQPSQKTIQAAPKPNATSGSTMKKIKELTLATREAFDNSTPIAEASSTPTTVEAPTSTAIAAPAPRQLTQQEDDTPWITVLGVIAGLCAIAALVSGTLAWREKNKF